jgi:elongation factor 2
MKKSGVTFNDVFNYCKEENQKELAERCPLHEVLNDTIIRFLPNPLVAQKDRVNVIWHGDKESQEYKDMVSANKEGDVALMVTNISLDPHAGEVATGRLFSGTLKRGMELHVSGSTKTNRLQQVGVFMGPERLEVEKIPGGNIAAVTGLKDAYVGATVSSKADMIPFESIKHASEPVVTVAVEAKHMKDLPKLVEVLRQVAKEDNTLKITINEETGEHLMSGMGELHLEVIGHRIERDKGVEITTSPPIVVYRETVQKHAGPVEGKSPNRHNRFYIEVEPLSNEVVDLIKSGEVSMRMPEVERREKFMEVGFSKDEAKSISEIYESNILIDMTKGIQYMNETMELVIDGFEEVMVGGPLSREPCQAIKVILVDAKLHEDAVHRGPAQVIPAVRSAIQAAMLSADDTLLEPYQNVFIQTPQNSMGGATSEIQGRRGVISNMTQEGDLTIIESRAPVAELFGFAGDIRSATEGRASWSTEFAGFEPLPMSLLKDVVTKIRQRKGLKAEMPKASDFVGL